MRIFRGLENIHAVIDRHEAEWRKEQGEEITERHPRVSLEESVRRRLTEQPVTEGSGKFSADRFLGGSSEPVKHEPEPEFTPEPETVNTGPEETEPEVRHSWLYNEVMKAVNHASGGKKDAKIIAVFIPVAQEGAEAREIPGDDAEIPDGAENVRAVEIIRNKDGKHSRLYDEVMRAVNDSAQDGRKIVAVFVPLLQDGKEFEDLPADETVTLSAVSEDAVKIETLPENEPETVPEDLPAITPAEDEEIPALIPVPAETDTGPELAVAETEPEIPAEPETEPEPEPEPAHEPEKIPEPETEPDSEAPELSADFDLIPEMKEPDPVVIEALQEIEEKLDGDSGTETENPAEEPEQETETYTEEPEPEISESEPEPEITADEEAPETVTDDTVPEIVPDEPETEYDDADDILQDGEPMVYENIENIGHDEPEQEEITLPAELEDDEIADDGGEFDESLTEVRTADDEDDTIILEDGGEIELLPEPEKE